MAKTKRSRPNGPRTSARKQDHTPDMAWVPKVLEKIRETANQSEASRAAGIDRSTITKAKERDKEFAAQLEDALEEGRDRIRGEVRRRAFGYEHQQVIGDGSVVTVMRYSDQLLKMLAIAVLPEFKDQSAGSAGVTVKFYRNVDGENGV